MIPPIKRGTARRLGIRQPPPRWLLDMQASINEMHRRMRAIRSAYGIESCCRAGQERFPSPCPWHGSQFA